jgi:hypothetical protein
MLPVAPMRPVSAGFDGAARGARVAGGIPYPAEPLHEHGIVLLRLGRLDQTTEQLVVPGGREPEIRADGVLFGPGVAAPLPLESEDGAITVGQGHSFTLTRRLSVARAPLHESSERIHGGERRPIPAEDEAAP